MDYKNMFCNLNGIVQIENHIYKYNDNGRYKLKIEDFNGIFDIEKSEFESLKSFINKKEISVRSDFGGSCGDEVGNRRIKCTNALDLDDFLSLGCSFPSAFNVELIAEAKNKFQRSTWLGWISAKADLLRIDIEFNAFDENGTNVLSVVDFRQSTNAYSTKWASVDSYCNNCNLSYTWEDYQFDFHGERGNTDYDCSHDLFLNVVDLNLCAF